MKWLPVVLLACKPPGLPPATAADADADSDADSDTDADTDTDTDADADTDADIDTGPYGPQAGQGSVVLRQVVGAPEVTLHGLFSTDLQNRTDPALCWPEALGPCPGPAWSDGMAPLPFAPGGTTLLGVGPTILLGPFGADRQTDPLAGVHYRGESPSLWPPGQVVGLAFAGGQWPPYVSSNNLALPPALELLSPASAETVRLLDGGTVTLEWTPDSGSHELTLQVIGAREPGAAPLGQLHVLDDDGVHVLQVDDLGLTSANETVRFVLARTQRTTVQVDGNPLSIATRTETSFEATHPDLADRLFLELGADCATSVPVLDGSYYSLLDFAVNTYDPGFGGCTRAPGRDGVVAVEVAAGERLTARARRLDGDASLYLLTSCDDLTTCDALADRAPAEATETLVYTNLSGIDETVYIITDSPVAGGLVQALDLQRDVPLVSPVADSCATANSEPSRIPGTYSISLADRIDHLDPGGGVCGVDAAGGGDVLVPVDVPAGVVLSAHVDAPVSLYLLSDCVDEGSCVTGASRYQPVRWLNPGVATTRQTLVVDQGASVPELATVDLQIEWVTPLADIAATCADLDAPLTTGLHLLSAQLTSNSIDLAVPGPSCTFDTSAGPDGVVPVRLEAGEQLTASYDHSGEGVLYLLTSCGDVTTTLSCDDQIGRGETLEVRNTSNAPVDWFLVLDSWAPLGSSPMTNSFHLDLRISP